MGWKKGGRKDQRTCLKTSYGLKAVFGHQVDRGGIVMSRHNCQPDRI